MNPNLCPIKTDDPKNPGYIDPSTVSFLVGFATPLGVKFCERGVDEARFIPTKLTTTQVVAALEAARGYSERERILIEGLKRMVDLSDNMDGLGWHPFLRSLLHDFDGSAKAVGGYSERERVLADARRRGIGNEPTTHRTNPGRR